MEVIACGISWSELESEWVINKKATKFRGPLFWPWYFQEVLHTFMESYLQLPFSRISKTNLETSVEYLQSHFLNHPACFFLEQTTDRQIDLLFWVLRYPAHCTGLESLYFNEIRVTYAVFDILKEAD